MTKDAHTRDRTTCHYDRSLTHASWRSRCARPACSCFLSPVRTILLSLTCLLTVFLLTSSQHLLRFNSRKVERILSSSPSSEHRFCTTRRFGSLNARATRACTTRLAPDFRARHSMQNPIISRGLCLSRVHLILLQHRSRPPSRKQDLEGRNPCATPRATYVPLLAIPQGHPTEPIAPTTSLAPFDLVIAPDCISGHH